MTRSSRTTRIGGAAHDGVCQPGDLVCHGDFGPWNLVWHGNRPVGILDWDYAWPHPPIHDVAYALEYVTPLRDDGASPGAGCQSSREPGDTAAHRRHPDLRARAGSGTRPRRRPPRPVARRPGPPAADERGCARPP
ncbi:phosphotransferase [Actinoplanes sp. NPDC023801]|uniref:phosphotransferase n=1 Tax=Actinoplanes sp. NPDC023801 TaxID=3154595 RepID=UPI0033CB6F81